MASKQGMVTVCREGISAYEEPRVLFEAGGKLYLSVAVIESTTVSAFFLMFCDVARAFRTPTTTMSGELASAAASPASGASATTCGACAAGPPLACA